MPRKFIAWGPIPKKRRTGGGVEAHRPFFGLGAPARRSGCSSAEPYAKRNLALRIVWGSGLENVTRKRARAIEYLLIEKIGRASNGAGTLSNINRGINPAKLDKYKTQLAWARKKLHDLGIDGF